MSATAAGLLQIGVLVTALAAVWKPLGDLYLLQRVQKWLPLNLGMDNVGPDTAFNTAASFTANTNWQSYSGETTMGHLVQMAGLAVQNFSTRGSSSAARRHPDVIVLDLGLPDMDGTEVIKGLRGWTPVPIIVLSARHSSDDKVDASIWPSCAANWNRTRRGPVT